MGAAEVLPDRQHHDPPFAIGDRVRLPSVPHWSTGRITGIHPDGRPRIEWDNGFIDVFNWLPIERVE